MNLTRFNRCLATVLFAVAGLLVAPPRAHAILGVGDTVFDPTMYATQLVQLQQATATVTNLAQQLQYEIRNTTGFAGGTWQPNTDFLGGLGNVIATEQGVSYTLTNLPTEFSLLFPGYTAPAGVPSQTAQQTGQGLNNTLATLGGRCSRCKGKRRISPPKTPSFSNSPAPTARLPVGCRRFRSVTRLRCSRPSKCRCCGR